MSKAADRVRRRRRERAIRLARIVAVLAGALAFAAMALTLTAGAGATSASVGHIYWTNTATSRGPEGPGIDTVAGADLNGGDININLVKTNGFPGAIAVDAKHIYWANDEGATIARADLNGSHVNYDFIPRPHRPVGFFQELLVHGDYIYWTQYGSTRIGRARVNGTNMNPNFVNIGPVKRFVEVLGLATDGKHLYWSDPESGGTIGRVDLNGNDVRRRFMVELGAVGSLAADGKHLYWANGRWGTINRADLNGRHRIRRFVVGPPAGTHIAVGAQHIYWTDYGASTIGRADLSGKEVNLSFIHAGVEKRNRLQRSRWAGGRTLTYYDAEPEAIELLHRTEGEHPMSVSGALDDLQAFRRRAAHPRLRVVEGVRLAATLILSTRSSAHPVWPDTLGPVTLGPVS